MSSEPLPKKFKFTPKLEKSALVTNEENEANLEEIPENATAVASRTSQDLDAAFEAHRLALKRICEDNRKIISDLEDKFLTGITGRDNSERHPFDLFFDTIYSIDPTKLRKHSWKNSQRVSRLRQLHLIANRIRKHGRCIINSIRPGVLQAAGDNDEQSQSDPNSTDDETNYVPDCINGQEAE